MVKINKKRMFLTIFSILLSVMLFACGLTLNTNKPQIDAKVKAETSSTLKGVYENGEYVGEGWYSKINYNLSNLLITTDNKKVPETYIEAPDVSVAKDGSLKAYVVAGANDTYDCIIYGNVDKIYAPADSARLFDNKNLNQINTIKFENFDTSRVTDMGCMFNNYVNLTSLDLSMFDTSNVTDMFAMFLNCTSLTDINLSSFNTSKVTGMNRMFDNCTSLKYVDLSGFDTSNVQTFASMFLGCSLDVLDLSNFDFSSVTSDSDVSGFIGINDTMVLSTINSYGDIASELLLTYQEAITNNSKEERIATVKTFLQNSMIVSDAEYFSQGLFNTNIQTIYAPVSVNNLNISLPYNNNATFVYDSGSGEKETSFLVGRDTLQELAIYPQNTRPLEKPEITGPLTPATGFDMNDIVLTTILGISLLIAISVVFVKNKKIYVNK